MVKAWKRVPMRGPVLPVSVSIMQTEAQTSNVMVVEDNELIRIGLRRVLEQIDQCEVASEAAISDATKYLEEHIVHIILLKFRMPDDIEFRFVQHLRSKYAQIKLIILLEEPEEFWEALSLDADGYELRHMPSYQLTAALKAIRDEYAWLGPMLSRYLLKQQGRHRLASGALRPTNDHILEPLSPREREVIHLLSDGLNGEQIAFKLQISPRTVKLHISGCIRKLEVKDRSQAIAKFLRTS